MVWCELLSEKQIIVLNSSMFQRHMLCTLLGSGLGDGGVMDDSMGPLVMEHPEDTITNTLCERGTKVLAASFHIPLAHVQ